MSGCGIKLGLEPSSSIPFLFNGIKRNKGLSSGDGDGNVVVVGGRFASNFFNLPNMISMSRIVSGPLIAWYTGYLVPCTLFLLCGIRVFKLIQYLFV